MSQKSQHGFVALMSVILISSILVTILFVLNLSSFFARYDALAIENKRISLGLAEACVESAKLKIAQNSAYAPPVGGESVTIHGAQTCKICAVTANGSNSYTIATRAVVNGSYSNVTMTGIIAPSSFAVTAWSENPSYAGPACTLP